MNVNLAVLGAGRIGKVHAQAIASNKHATLSAIADSFEEAATALAQEHGAVVLSIEDIETASDIDGVIICTPTHTHADLIERFARAGKAIFCEKPIDLDLARVRACLSIVDQTEAVLMVGFNRRFDPQFAAIQQSIADGQIGDVEMVSITSRDPGLASKEILSWSGGLFKDMSIHDFDMARFLLGEEPVSVSAHGSVLVDSIVAELNDIDSASIILETKSGKQALISNSRRATYGYDQRVEVHGSKGIAIAENLRPVSIEIANENGFTKPPLHHFFMTRYDQAYALEIDAFVSCITDKLPASPSGYDGFAALAVAEAANRSLKDQRRVSIAEVMESIDG